MEQLNYTKLNDKPIRLMWSHRDPNTRKNPGGNIFIKNLEESIDTKALHDTFEAFGKIVSAKARARARPLARTPRRARARACAPLVSHPRALSRRPCARAAARPLSPPSPCVSIYLFSYPCLTQVSQTVDGKSRGFGFIQFDSEEAAAKAIESVNGMLVEGRKVFVGPFQKKVERGGDASAKFTNSAPRRAARPGAAARLRLLRRRRHCSHTHARPLSLLFPLQFL